MQADIPPTDTATAISGKSLSPGQQHFSSAAASASLAWVASDRLAEASVKVLPVECWVGYFDWYYSPFNIYMCTEHTIERAKVVIFLHLCK